MANIKFGTDGWRAVVGEDFNNENVELCANAIAKYVSDTYSLDKKIIIGYDPRNKADFYANMTAKIFSQWGFKVLISDKFLPTPALAYGAKLLNASALMFTASHNPSEYLGIKYIPDYAGPATDDITKKIAANLGCKTIEAKEITPPREVSFFEDYYRHIKTIIDFEKIRSLDKNIFFDALYSAANGYFDKILDLEKIKYTPLHNWRDTDFGGGLPEPKPEFLGELIEKVKQTPNSVGLSNDGDADRYGVINELGEYVTPNEVMGMLLIHLVKNKKMTGDYVKTVGASLIHDILARKLGIKVLETPVGFKHVGLVMRENDVILAGEESGGLSIKGHIPEKDGMLANLLVLEMLAFENKPLFELQKDLHDFIGENFLNDRIDIHLNTQEEICALIEKFKTDKDLRDLLKVKSECAKDGIKLYLENGKSWILIRPSGTEPLLRVYLETNSKEKMDALKKIICEIM